ncbi:MAG: NAD(P)-dependent oxidoreductase [Planctomycetota bacterium]|nr:NAD(P)-dependent oxidoreductase [Planctomycetota bacterium]
MRAFITGVTGFAGSHLAEHLLACGDEVLGSSHRGHWPLGVPDAVQRAVPLIVGDLTTGVDEAARQTVNEFRPDVIFHLAAISVPSECGTTEPTAQALASNVGGTQAVIELCRLLADRPRVLLASSCYVYAPVSFDSPVVTEDAPLDPQRAYGKTKRLAEQAFRRAIQDEKLDGVITRSFQHVGPRQSHRMILPDWVHQFTASDDGPIRVGCLDTYLDLTDVRDICRAYRQLVVDGQRGTVYNVGSGIVRRSGDLLEVIQRCSGSRREVIELEPGHRQHPIADISRLTQLTGWKPAIPLEQTVTDTLSYWRERRSRKEGMDS